MAKNAPFLHLIAVPEVADRLGCSRATTYRLIRSGQIKSVRIGGRRLVHEDELHRIAEHGTAPAADHDAEPVETLSLPFGEAAGHGRASSAAA